MKTKPSNKKASKTTAQTPKTSPPAVDAVAQAYDALSRHDREELLSNLGSAVVDNPRRAAGQSFGELPPLVQAAVRASRE